VVGGRNAQYSEGWIALAGFCLSRLRYLGTEEELTRSWRGTNVRTSVSSHAKPYGVEIGGISRKDRS